MSDMWVRTTYPNTPKSKNLITTLKALGKKYNAKLLHTLFDAVSALISDHPNAVSEILAGRFKIILVRPTQED